jgi:hypothetical protein
MAVVIKRRFGNRHCPVKLWIAIDNSRLYSSETSRSIIVTKVTESLLSSTKVESASPSHVQEELDGSAPYYYLQFSGFCDAREVVRSSIWLHPPNPKNHTHWIVHRFTYDRIKRVLEFHYFVPSKLIVNWLNEISIPTKVMGLFLSAQTLH